MSISLYNDDCLKILDELIEKNIKVDAIITDPPYELQPHGGGRSGLSKRSIKLREDIDWIANGFDYKTCFEKMLKVCNIPNLLIFCSNMQLGKTISFFEDKGLSVTTLIWEKDNPAPLCNNNYISDVEFCVYVHGVGACWNKKAPYEIKHKVKHYPIITSTQQKYHPTQKPLALIKELVELHTLKNMTVLDCFMGSGTTGIACKELERNFIGIEIEKKYFDIAEKRINQTLRQLELFDDEKTDGET